jgi:hypothetical protein
MSPRGLLPIRITTAKDRLKIVPPEVLTHGSMNVPDVQTRRPKLIPQIYIVERTGISNIVPPDLPQSLRGKERIRAIQHSIIDVSALRVQEGHHTCSPPIGQCHRIALYKRPKNPHTPRISER